MESKFICWGGEEAIDENLVCDGNFDCPVEFDDISSDETAYQCAADGEHLEFFTNSPQDKFPICQYISLKYNPLVPKHMLDLFHIY